MTELEKVSEETMRFMRGKYALDEVAGKYYELDCLKFRQGKKTILSINILPDRYDFQIIFGRIEREKFDARRDEFPQWIQDIYDNSHTYHDGKWMMFPIADLEALEAVKPLIFIKKKPNRKPFPKEQAYISDCGHRCDLCIHYTGGTISEELRAELKERMTRVYKAEFWGEDMMLCPGCHDNRYEDFDGDPCDQKKCAAKKSVDKCLHCGEYANCQPQVGKRGRIEPVNMSAADVTWTILPFVQVQYGN